MPGAHPKAEAFAATTFCVHAPECHIPIRVNRPSHANGDGALDRLLEQCGVREYAFITAHNPNAERHSEPFNAAAQERLRNHLQQRGFAFFPGVGKPSAPDSGDEPWPDEPSFLVLGISKAAAQRLGREFGQAAIVHGALGAPATIAWCTSRSGRKPSLEEDR